MSKDIFLGEYAVIRTLGSPTNGTVVFEVTKSNNPKQKYLAEAHQLTTNINLRTLVEAVRKGDDNGIAEEVICFTKNERQFLVIIRDYSRKTTKGVRLDQLQIDPADCIRLAMEAIELVEGLHMMGIYLECPLGFFVQVEDNDKSTMGMPRIKPPVSYDNFQGSTTTRALSQQLSVQ